ncbi:MAG: tetratricopeptide repeat-containing diguanylate cyclase, partial [Pseudomonadota bacterium]
QYNIAQLYINQKDFDNAKIFIEKSYQGSIQLKDEDGIAHALLSLGIIALGKEQFHDAIHYLKESEKLFLKLENRSLLADTHSHMARAFMHTNQLNLALKFIKLSESTYLENNTDKQLVRSKKTLAKIYQRMGKTTEENKALWEYITINNRYLTEQYQRQTHFLKTKFDLESTNQLNKALKVENEKGTQKLQEEIKTRQFYFYSSITILVLAFALIYFIFLQIRSQKRLKALAITDSLTGLNNRRAIQKITARLIEESARHQQPLSLSIIDLDFFKKINDEMGHVIGDKVLQKFALHLQDSIRKFDYVARFGGEEFIIVMPQTNDLSAKDIIDRISQSCSGLPWYSIHKLLNVTFSAGIAQYKKSESFEHLYTRADKALYKAKEGGRNCSYIDSND